MCVGEDGVRYSAQYNYQEVDTYPDGKGEEAGLDEQLDCARGREQSGESFSRTVVERVSTAYTSPVGS